jgi:ASCH domain
VKCLTVRQPWAWLIIAGRKDIENRSWYTRWTGKLGIHAGVNKTHLAEDIATVRRQHGIVVPDNLVFGALIGTVDLVGCVEDSASDWFDGPYGFVLANPKLLARPVPMRGQMGFFDFAKATTTSPVRALGR